MRTAARSTLTLALLLGALSVSGLATAGESYGIEIRIISAQPNGRGIDPALRRYAQDLKTLPYKSFKQLDSQSKRLKKGETVSMQFPGAGRRFLKVRANGTQGGKHRFTFSIDALKFSTAASIPDNGTLIVGGPKHKAGVILLAITARSAP